jgi:predicted GH43/DUF377 family glycosyl hydrolase
MKKIFVLFSLFLVLLIIGCSSDPVGSDNPKDSGKIILKIDKQNAPASVVFVKAYLTRENHLPITGTLNLQSDSTADILLDNINAGEWHLKVDAEDDSGLVLYTGETQVQIFAGLTSQVYLTLNPTGSGTGSIYISVTWGVPINYSWIDYYNNPILKPSENSYFDSKGVGNAVILFDENIYKMWFTTISSDSKGYVFYATSTDGISWVRAIDFPVLSPSSSNTWDDGIVSAGAVIKVDSLYKMYYSGYSYGTGIYQIGLATSADGINWFKNPNPILTGSSNWETNVGVTDVIKINNTYYLYYHGRTSDVNYQINIGLATSVDGNIWEKYSGNPILTKTQAWEGNGVLFPSIIYENNLFTMVYGNALGSISGFGIATSVDGISWIKSNNNPFFTKDETTNQWAYQEISHPYFRKFSNEFRIYYTGFYNNKSALGLVRKLQ